MRKAAGKERKKEGTEVDKKGKRKKKSVRKHCDEWRNYSLEEAEDDREREGEMERGGRDRRCSGLAATVMMKGGRTGEIRGA